MGEAEYRRRSLRVYFAKSFTLVASDGRKIPAKCIDIGLGGLRCTAQAALSQGDAVSMEICFPKDETTRRVEGTIVHAAGEPPQYRIAFTPSTVDRLSRDSVWPF